jgi:hypothetical protein
MIFEMDLYGIGLTRSLTYLLLQGSSTMNTFPVRFLTVKVVPVSSRNTVERFVGSPESRGPHCMPIQESKKYSAVHVQHVPGHRSAASVAAAHLRTPCMQATTLRTPPGCFRIYLPASEAVHDFQNVAISLYAHCSPAYVLYHFCLLLNSKEAWNTEGQKINPLCRGTPSDETMNGDLLFMRTR